MYIILNVLLSIATVFLLGGGVYFSIKMKFPQLQWKKMFISSKNIDNSGISPFKSLMMSLAARIGVGSVAGIALAIYIGGPGTIFWIWIIGIITSVNTYCESYLGAKYQIKDKDGYKGGPAYYILKGLNNHFLATLYSTIIIIAYIFGFMTIQANTITISITNFYKINPIIIAIVISIISFFSILKGLKTVVGITSKIVPIIGIGYILLSYVVIIKNINLIPSVIINIIKSALNIKSFITSFIPSFITGSKRAVFSTEAGLGTSSIASSTTYTKNKINLGLMQILGIYFTIFIICTSTALIILTSPYDKIIINNINGIELTQYALLYHLGSIGNVILILSIIFLAYSTIIAGYYYGESNLRFLCDNEIIVFILKIITVFLLFFGSLMRANVLWNIVDVLVELLAIINMYALFRLRKEIIFDYKKKK